MKTLFSLSATALLLAGAEAAELVFDSGPRPVALVELFTSEGCSSCPPAEAWLARLERHGRLWLDFVPIAFHVTYWDRLGWKDPLAADAFTARQYRYAEQWRSRSVYTPGFVLNGRDWRGWAGTAGPPATEGTSPGRLRVTSAEGRVWHFSFEPLSADRTPAAAGVALLGFDLHSEVTAGENQGRRLDHTFAALSLATGQPKLEGTRWTSIITLPAGRRTTRRTAVAAWVTTADGTTVLQATGGWLPATPGVILAPPRGP